MAAVTIAQAVQLAIEHQQSGRLAEAEAIYRQVVAQDPNHAQALHLLGTLAYQVDAFEPAAELIRRAIAIKGEWPQACYHLGLALQGAEQFEQAIAAHRRAVALDPALAAAHYNLGVCLQVTGQRARAIAAYGQAIALNGDDVYVCSNLGLALQSAGRLAEAIALHRRAVVAKPDLPDAHLSLGRALRESGQLDEAVAAFERAVALRADEAEGYVQLAGALHEAGRLQEAIAAQGRAVALRPDDAEAHCTLATLLLSNGDWARGWPELEWRWRRKRLPWPRRRFTQPRWDGDELAGRTILLHAERSIGDTIQFMRYVPLILQRGAKVIVECQPGLRRLVNENLNKRLGAYHPVGSAPRTGVSSPSEMVRGADPTGEIEGCVSPGEPLPPFDVYCPLLSLPGIMATTLKTIPHMSPWHPHADAAEAWRWKLAGDAHRLKVGLAWAGSPSELADSNRSMSLSMFAPLARVKDAGFYSLQTGRAAAQAGHPPAGMSLHDFSADLADFADTAALIAHLDLVICVDTAVAHLAGAMGKPVWMLLPFVADWRWMRGRHDTPWYPTMRLFRQTVPADWNMVMNQVADELSNQGIA